MVARYFGPLIAGRAPMHRSGAQGGRVVTVTGVRGGAGASTIAANLAWHFGVEARRHTVLLDADLHLGTAAMLLGAKPAPACAPRWRRPTASTNCSSSAPRSRSASGCTCWPAKRS